MAADAQLLGRVTYHGFATSSATRPPVPDGPGWHPGPSGLAAYPETVTLTPASRSQSPVVAVACTTALALGA